MLLTLLPVTSGKLYDGLEDGFFDFEQTLPPPANLTVTTWDFLSNRFDELAATLPAANLQQVRREGNLQWVAGEFGGYRGHDNFPVRYLQTADLLVLLASGEFQPGRYKIYLQGVWRQVA